MNTTTKKLQIVTMDGDGVGAEIMPEIKQLVEETIPEFNKKKGTSLAVEFISAEMGMRAFKKHGEALPQSTIDMAKEHLILFKGPTEAPSGTKPDGTPHTSANVALRKAGDYYVCVRPVFHMPNVPTNFKVPNEVNWVIFRENSEGLYGMPNVSVEMSKKLIHYLAANSEFRKIADALMREGNQVVQLGTISEYATKRMMRAALDYAIKHGHKVITLVHKNNIFKTADGMFTTWCKEVIEQEYADKAVRYPDNWKLKRDTIEDEFMKNGKIIVDDSIVDAFFVKSFQSPENFEIIVTENFKGDVMSDYAAALVGGLGVAPGSNNNFENGKMLLEATHGTAPDIAGKDIANPTSMLLSLTYGLEQIGGDWYDYGMMMRDAIAAVFKQGIATGDIAMQDPSLKKISLSGFMACTSLEFQKMCD